MTPSPFTISAVIPTWNRGKTIRAAVESVLAQSYPVTEILICDDGSTDDTAQVVSSIEDPRIRWLPGERSGGPAQPRNRGIENARGEWVAFLDSDDEWLPQKLERQIERIQASRCKASSCNAVRFIPGQG